MSSDVFIIILVVVAAVGAGLCFLNRWASKKMVSQQSIIEKSKQQASIYVIDKKRDKIDNVTIPKAVSENMPKAYKLMKLCFVKAKIGPQIVTLMCEKKVYEVLEPKKNYKVELAGLYIVSVKGMKSDQELKEIEANRKRRAKEDAKAAKEAKKALAKK